MTKDKYNTYHQSNSSNTISIRTINITDKLNTITIPHIHTGSGGSATVANSKWGPGSISGSGGGGSIYTASGGHSIYGPASQTVFDQDVVIKRDGKPDIYVGETLAKITERLAIIEPDLDKMSKFPALKEAYDNYKMIEALVAGMDDDEQSS